jgi:MOSC domain-containing protein YiiM
MSGHIFQISASDGGVPKRALRDAEVTAHGLSADKHAHPQIHGGPNAALCIFSLERILVLQAEGHPIFPGSAGENLTLAGLDWELVTPGKRLRLGDNVLVEITRFTTPCATIADSFAHGERNRILDTEHPGWSRVYAKVLQAGHIRVGAKAIVEN